MDRPVEIQFNVEYKCINCGHCNIFFYVPWFILISECPLYCPICGLCEHTSMAV